MMQALSVEALPVPGDGQLAGSIADRESARCLSDAGDAIADRCVREATTAISSAYSQGQFV